MTDLKSMTLEEMTILAKELGEPAFRGKQIFHWLHRGVTDFEDMSDLSKSFREKLKNTCAFTPPQVERKQISAHDGTIKYLWRLSDGNCVETVLMRYRHGNTVCISSQVGCRMGCAFCASTIGGKVRNLTPAEMLDQVLFTQLDSGAEISNIVLMGIGEPLDNMDNVLRFLALVNSPHGLNIGMRHISLSTWFKEYVYIPLGGNRKGSIRTYINLFIVFLLTGFWHGASLTFVFWGLFHGFFMIVERLGFGKVLEKNPLKFLNHLYAWIVVVCGWVLFRMDGMKKGIAFLKAMFVYQKGEYNITACLNAEVILILLLGLLFCGILQNWIPKLKETLYRKEEISVFQTGCLFVIFFLCVISLSADSYNPFIYFRF